MQGASRAALAAGRKVLEDRMSSGADREQLAEELFGAAAALDSSAALRRALTEPSHDARARRALMKRLFGEKVHESAGLVLDELAGQRWSDARDLPEAVEALAVETVVADAEAHQRLDALEDELFRFGRIVAGTAELRDALSARGRSSADRSEVVRRLLDGRVAPETTRLALKAVQAPRGRRFDRALSYFLDIAAARRDQLTAVVTAATPLDDDQRERLARALSAIYGRSVQVNVILDKAVVGGIRVQVGDEVVDGTILARLEHARRAMTA